MDLSEFDGQRVFTIVISPADRFDQHVMVGLARWDGRVLWLEDVDGGRVPLGDQPPQRLTERMRGAPRRRARCRRGSTGRGGGVVDLRGDRRCASERSRRSGADGLRVCALLGVRSGSGAGQLTKR